MVIEIIGGWYYNSMALLADGHMSSHVVALGVALFAYVIARRMVALILVCGRLKCLAV